MYEYSFISDFFIFLIFPFFDTVETPVNNIQTKVNYNLYLIIYINPISQLLNYSMMMTPNLSTFPKYIYYTTDRQDVLKLDACKEAHCQGEPSENDGQRAVHNNSRVHRGGNKKSSV